MRFSAGRYPNYTFEVHELRAIVSSSGRADVAVAAVAEPLQFGGVGVAVRPDARGASGRKDRAYWVRGGVECEGDGIDDSSYLHRYTNVSWAPGHGLVGNASASFVFDDDYAGETLELCYVFGDEPAVKYANATEAWATRPWPLPSAARFAVMDVSQVVSVALARELAVAAADAGRGAVDVAVVGAPKPLTFVGGGLGEGDRVRWLANASAGCDAVDTPPADGWETVASGDNDGYFSSAGAGARSPFAPLGDRDVNGKRNGTGTLALGVNASSQFTFARPSAGHTVTLCYKHGGGDEVGVVLRDHDGGSRA